MREQAKKRQGFVERAERIRSEINQIFADAEYYNLHVRKLREREIDPDPRGELKAALNYVEEFLKGSARNV